MDFRRPRVSRRVALALALTALVLLGGLAGLWSWRRRSPPLPMYRHQVALEVPPLDAALWFVDRYPEYFTSGEQGLDEWLATLPERERVFVEAMAQTLTWAWVAHELEGFSAADPEGLARESIVALRHKTLNQLEFQLEWIGATEDMELLAYRDDPHFGDGVFARLVRGVSNCDGQNHLLALLLDAALDPSDRSPLAPRAELAGIPVGHELVVVDGPTLRQPIYVDGWANLPPFTLAGSPPASAPTLAELGDHPPWVVAEASGRAPHPASVYAEAEPRSIELLPPRHAPTRPVSLKVRAPRLDDAALAEIHDPWRLYLFARVLHLYDDPRAAGLYELVLERFCQGSDRHRFHVCVASAAFVDRLQ